MISMYYDMILPFSTYWILIFKIVAKTQKMSLKLAKNVLKTGKCFYDMKKQEHVPKSRKMTNMFGKTFADRFSLLWNGKIQRMKTVGGHNKNMFLQRDPRSAYDYFSVEKVNGNVP